MSLKSNITKAIRYLKKNGIRHTVYAGVERVFFPYYKDYTYLSPSKEELIKQRKTKFSQNRLFSIVVPTYETKEAHLKEMIESVLMQSYENFELILADASQSDTVEKVVKLYQDTRIVYKKLDENLGISDNTNVGICLAKGDYIGLLDHDDLLTYDALYEVMCKIEEEKKSGKDAMIIFSDEDKCNEDGSYFFEPHFKMDYNKELLFTNNYICHFLVTKAELMKELMLRQEFDGAQDFDFILRATACINRQISEGKQVTISHISKVLYHWRCHENSTAENPESKMYAYEAGKRATCWAMKQEGRNVEMTHEKHLGFYRAKVETKENLFKENKKLACIGGAIYQKGKIVGGAMTRDGEVTYAGLHKGFSGYMNRANLMQNAEALDLRNIIVREELQSVFEEITQLPYVKKSQKDNIFDYKKALKEAGKKEPVDFPALSLVFCEKLKKMGYEIIYWET